VTAHANDHDLDDLEVKRRQGAKLREMAGRAQVTQADLARVCRVGPQAVYNWMSGRTRPSRDNVMAIDTALQAGGAVLEVYGYQVSGDRIATESAIMVDARLTEPQRQLLRMMLAEFVAANEREGVAQGIGKAQAGTV